jgi:hypothetical protein
VTEQPHPPLRPQHGQPPGRRSRATPWALVIGIVLLAVLATVLAVLLLTRGDGGTASGSPTPTPPTGASPSATASVAPSASTSAGTPAPSAAGPTLPHDTIVATTVERLSVRSGPGLGAERLGSLGLGAQSFVVDGPTGADGYAWYLVSGLGLPPNTGCSGPLETDPFNCPIWFGWVAAASEAGDPWLEIAGHDTCPVSPLTASNLAIGRTALQRLQCFGAGPITFRGWWPEIPDNAGLGGACVWQDEPAGWLLCQNINYNFILADESEDFFGLGVRVSIDPASGASMPERGTWVEVRAHLDDPAAQSCDETVNAFSDPERPDAQIVLDCRVELVLEEAVAVGGP